MIRPMAEDETQGGRGRRGAGGEPQSEEELRAQLEEEIRKVRIEDVVLQSAVSILNLAARGSPRRTSATSARRRSASTPPAP